MKEKYARPHPITKLCVEGYCFTQLYTVGLL